MACERKRDSNGRFGGLRVNVEDVPRLPPYPARWALEDPRQHPYLVYWAPQNGPAWALKMAPAKDGAAVVVTLRNGETQRIEVLRRRLPRGTGRALFYLCPSCRRPRRYLYPLALSGTTLVAYRGLLCQQCAKLTFASQGWYKPAGTAEWGPRGRSPQDPQAVSDPRLIAEDIGPTRS